MGLGRTERAAWADWACLKRSRAVERAYKAPTNDQRPSLRLRRKGL